jgi:hypothetical protein
MVMAKALGWTLDQFAAMGKQKRPDPQNGSRADDKGYHPLVGSSTLRYADGRSVPPTDIPNATIYRSFAFGIGKDQKMFVDLLVSGPDDRTGIDIGRELD